MTAIDSQAVLIVSARALGTVTDKTFLIRFKPATYLGLRPLLAARAEIHGEHLVFLNSVGKLVALLLLEAVESWVEIA
jgi:hypothetical protein